MLVAMAPTASTASAVSRIPSPGTSDPNSRSATGPVSRFASRTSHTSATTVIASGTETKNPVTNVRRSHPHIARHLTASQTSVAAATASRYHANTSSRWVVRNLMKYFTVTYPTTADVTSPTPIAASSPG